MPLGGQLETLKRLREHHWDAHTVAQAILAGHADLPLLTLTANEDQRMMKCGGTHSVLFFPIVCFVRMMASRVHQILL